MCLYTNNSEFKTADKDIVCYKLLERVKDPQGNVVLLKSPFFHQPYYIGDTYTLRSKLTDNVLELEAKDDGEKFKPGYYDGTEIDNGFDFRVCEGLHTFDEHAGMLESQLLAVAVSELKLTHKHDFSLVKCIIPKGTRYIDGYHHTICRDVCNESGYVSEALRIVEEVKIL